VAVDGVVFRFLERARALAVLTEGAFDPTVGALLARLRRPEPASDEELAAACELVGFARLVELDAAAGTVRFRRPGVRLDPGAIGKGWALDRAAELLREAGVRAALLHGGTSSVYALGAPPGEDGWAVAVQDPLVPEGRLARIVLRDRALGVSAIHGRVFRRGDERVGHVLDPRSGRAVDHTLLAAVALPSATDADAVSTALLVLGEAGVARMADRVPDAAMLVGVRGRRGVRQVVRGTGFTRAASGPGRAPSRAARRGRTRRRGP
jgi:thiamine biosynthesis lipoprotein